MNEIEAAKLIIIQNGSCIGVPCEKCPAEKVRQKLELNSCNDIWGGDNDEYCKRWFEDWLKEQEKNMSDKIQMTEEQARFKSVKDFCDFCFIVFGIMPKPEEIEAAQLSGYIKKSELQQKVEKAEEMYLKIQSEREFNDLEVVLIRAFRELKQSHPEFKEKRYDRETSDI